MSAQLHVFESGSDVYLDPPMGVAYIALFVNWADHVAMVGSGLGWRYTFMYVSHPVIYNQILQ